MNHYRGLLLMYYGQSTKIVSILQIKKLNRVYIYILIIINICLLCIGR